jgi:hypothetical protein
LVTVMYVLYHEKLHFLCVPNWIEGHTSHIILSFLLFSTQQMYA